MAMNYIEFIAKTDYLEAFQAVMVPLQHVQDVKAVWSPNWMS